VRGLYGKSWLGGRRREWKGRHSLQGVLPAIFPERKDVPDGIDGKPGPERIKPLSASANARPGTWRQEREKTNPMTAEVIFALTWAAAMGIDAESILQKTLPG